MKKEMTLEELFAFMKQQEGEFVITVELSREETEDEQ